MAKANRARSLVVPSFTKAVLIAWTEVDGDSHDGFFAFITASGMNEVTPESLTDLYLNR